MLQSNARIRKTAGALQSTHWKQITCIFVLPVVIFYIVVFAGNGGWLVSLLLAPLFPIGCGYYCMRLVQNQTAAWRNVVYFFTSPKRMAKAYLIYVLSAGISRCVYAVTLMFTPPFAYSTTNALMITFFMLLVTIVVATVLSLVLTVWQYQLALAPEISVAALLRSVGKLRGHILRYVGLCLSVLWKLVLVILIITFMFSKATEITGTVPLTVLYGLVMLLFYPHYYLCSTLFFYELLTGKVPDAVSGSLPPMKSAEPQNAFTEHATVFQQISTQFNTCEGVRTNVTLGVVGGVSPSELLPEPESRELAEGEELLQDEDWEALYGGADTPEREENEKLQQEMENDAERYWDGLTQLQPVNLHSTATAGTLDALTGAALLAAADGLPAYIKDDSGIEKWFEKLLQTALEDLRGYAGTERKGMAAAAKVFTGGNRFRVIVRVQEHAPPVPCEAVAELFINE